MPRLRKCHQLVLTTQGLIALRDGHPRFTLPRLCTVRQLDLRIVHFSPQWGAFNSGTLFNALLPLLGTIFGGVKHLRVEFNHVPIEETEMKGNVSLSGQLSAKMWEHFPSVRSCKALYVPIDEYRRRQYAYEDDRQH